MCKNHAQTILICQITSPESGNSKTSRVKRGTYDHSPISTETEKFIERSHSSHRTWCYSFHADHVPMMSTWSKFSEIHQQNAVIMHRKRNERDSLHIDRMKSGEVSAENVNELLRTRNWLHEDFSEMRRSRVNHLTAEQKYDRTVKGYYQEYRIMLWDRITSL